MYVYKSALYNLQSTLSKFWRHKRIYCRYEWVYKYMYVIKVKCLMCVCVSVAAMTHLYIEMVAWSYIPYQMELIGVSARDPVLWLYIWYSVIRTGLQNKDLSVDCILRPDCKGYGLLCSPRYRWFGGKNNWASVA